MLESKSALATPNPEVTFDCGSTSTIKVFFPNRAKEAARLMAVVVLPTPPFWFATATIFICLPWNSIWLDWVFHIRCDPYRHRVISAILRPSWCNHPKFVFPLFPFWLQPKDDRKPHFRRAKPEPIHWLNGFSRHR